MFRNRDSNKCSGIGTLNTKKCSGFGTRRYAGPAASSDEYQNGTRGYAGPAASLLSSKMGLGGIMLSLAHFWMWWENSWDRACDLRGWRGRRCLCPAFDRRFVRQATLSAGKRLPQARLAGWGREVGQIYRQAAGRGRGRKMARAWLGRGEVSGLRLTALC